MFVLTSRLLDWCQILNCLLYTRQQMKYPVHTVSNFPDLAFHWTCWSLPHTYTVQKLAKLWDGVSDFGVSPLHSCLLYKTSSHFPDTMVLLDSIFWLLKLVKLKFSYCVLPTSCLLMAWEVPSEGKSTFTNTKDHSMKFPFKIFCLLSHCSPEFIHSLIVAKYFKKKCVSRGACMAVSWAFAFGKDPLSFHHLFSLIINLTIYIYFF